MRAYYNDHDKNVCLWLEQLIKNGDITKGDVDDRSITEINPEDISGYDRVHLFAGIGTWDYALNQAGWGDKPVLTASLPCQPFSAAGKGLGKQDERHLLPQAINIIIQSGIDTIFGEQVEKAIKFGWLDDLQTIMEAEGYAVGHCVLGAHSASKEAKTGVENKLFRFIESRFGGVESDLFRNWWFERGFCDGFGAEPSHIRQRLYWVANSDSAGSFKGWEASEGARYRYTVKPNGSDSRTGNAKHKQHKRELQGCRKEPCQNSEWKADELTRSMQTTSGIEWLWCRGNKYKPIKSGIFPLVDESTGKLVHSSDTSLQIEANNTQEARAMRLKGYGNAIQAQTAEMFIRAYIGISDK